MDIQNIKDIAEFSRWDDETKAQVKAVWPLLEEHFPDILTRFYKHIEKTPRLAPLIVGKTDNLRKTQTNHWKMIFKGDLDNAYFESIDRIGKVHVKIGLPPDWHIGGYNFVMSEVTQLLAKKHRWSSAKLARDLAAVQKVILLDMSFAVSAYEEAILEEREQRRQHLEQAIKQFEDRITQHLELSGELSDQLVSHMKSLKETSEQSCVSAQAANQSASDTANNMQNGAAAVEEMAATVSNVGMQANHSAETAQSVSTDAERTNETVLGLQGAVNEIGAVTELISAIAEQTNLLALNATIEAARAGNAGRGFAVVASEVKELASQTSQATNEIANKIGAIQNETALCVDEISSIVSKIDAVSNIASAIAGAVEQQGAATNEISYNIQAASTSASGTTEEVTGIFNNTNSSLKVVSATVEVTDEIHREAQSIRQEISSFFENIKAA
ncbi:chemotaxis protein [Pseudovibrio japonicus]|uniref:Chemotaxis protein n=1 Tax=Pseudovibrio japonicus TaxID=366534 RepID=A0ABQ3EI61_9HYPH|nr:globin-coupled sensor protein [Pseudovibrio japonicus]GHB40534.1 chemotaxis protein [Pseudovibrio japonicus]